MFFILSKLLTVLLSPFFMALLLTILSLLFAKYRRMFLLTSILIIMVFGNPMLFRTTIQWWENKPVNLPKNDVRIKKIVVLGGMSAQHEESQRIRFGQSGDRLMQALLLWQHNDAEALILSGGSASIMNKERGESAFLIEFLIDLGLESGSLFVDSLSRNTHENALHTAEIFRQNDWPLEIALVTSAWHMPRAQKCFEKQGFSVIAIGADPLYPFSDAVPTDWFMPSLSVLSSWELIIKEWVGFIVYKIRGYA